MAVLSTLRGVVVGFMGVGKSQLSSRVVGKKGRFASSLSARSVTKATDSETVNTHGIEMIITDTMGLSDPEGSPEYARSKITEAVALCGTGVNFFWIVIRMGRFSLQDQVTIEYLMSAILGKQSFQNAILVVTHAPVDWITQPSGKEKQIKWLEDAKGIPYFAKILSEVNGRIVFVANDDESSDPAVEEVLEEAREASIDSLLKLTINHCNDVEPYRIEAVQHAQQEHDAKLAAIEQEKLEAQRKRDQEIKIDATRVANAEWKREQERREAVWAAEQKAREEHARALAAENERVKQQLAQAHVEAQRAAFGGSGGGGGGIWKQIEKGVKSLFRW